MRIGYLISQYPAASHTFILREVEELRRRGIEIETFSIRRRPPIEYKTPRTRAAYDTTYFVLPIRFGELVRAHAVGLMRPLAYFRTLRFALHHRAPGIRAFIWALFHFIEAIILARALRQRGVDHLHNHFANNGANVGLTAARFLGLPWSVTLHGISEFDYPAGLLLPEKLRLAEFAACVSWFGKAQAMRMTPPEDWSKMFVARCGLNLHELPAPRAPDRVAEGGQRIICVGRLSAEKGHLGLFEAFAGLRAEGIDVKLAMIGDGPDREWIRHYCNTHGFGDAVMFLGLIDEEDTLREIAASDLLVLPSFMEGLPIVLMEAMALGVPVVASHVAGVPELIADGEEGLLFRPADWDDLRDKLRRMLTDAPLRCSAAAAARRKIAAEYDIEVVVAPLLTHFGVKNTPAILAIDDSPETQPMPRLRQEGGRS